MKNFWIKFKLIVPVSLLLITLTGIFLIGFRWLFTVKWQLIEIKEDYFNIWLPIIFPWLPILIWLRPKSLLLSFKNNNNAPLMIQMIVWLTMVWFLVVSNSFLKTSTGNLCEVNTLTTLNSVECDYIKIKKLIVFDDKIASNTKFYSSGKYYQNYNIDIYFACPLSDNEFINNNRFWLVKKFSKRLPSISADEIKKEAYNDFYYQSESEFLNLDLKSIDYYEILTYSEDSKNFKKAINRLGFNANEDVILINPQKGFYNDINGNKLGWIFGSLFIGLSVLIFSLFFPRISNKDYAKFIRGEKSKKDELFLFFDFLTPSKNHVATPILIDINILFYLLMVFSGVHLLYPDSSDLLNWGAIRFIEFEKGEWWRIILYQFIHGGVLHLILNMVGLAIVSFFLEKIIGSLKVIGFYLLFGILAGLTSLYYNDDMISVGASGAIFGLYGLGVVLLFKARKEKGSNLFVLSVVIFILINLGFGFLMSGIDNAAHVGGFISGLFFGIFVNHKENNS